MSSSLHHVPYNAKSNDQYIKIAEELHYPKKVMERLKNAKSESECIRIMNTARNNLR